MDARTPEHFLADDAVVVSGIGERMDNIIASENEGAQEAQDSAEELGYGDEMTADEGDE